MHGKRILNEKNREKYEKYARNTEFRLDKPEKTLYKDIEIMFYCQEKKNYAKENTI